MLENNIQAHFSSRAPTYDSGEWVNDDTLIAAFVAELPPRMSGILVDAGGGTGILSAAIAAFDPGYRVLCLDLCRAMLAFANNRCITCIQADIQSLPLGAKSVDVVIMRQVLHYCTSTQRALDEACHIVRSEGKVIVGQFVPFSEDDQAWMAEVMALRQPLRKNFLSIPELIRGLTMAGCSKIHCVEFLRKASLSDWLGRYALNDPTGFKRIRELFLDNGALGSPREITLLGEDIRFINRFAVVSGTVER